MNEISNDTKLLKFIKMLQRGQTIKIDGQYFCLAENNRLCIRCVDENLNLTDKLLDVGEFNFNYLYSLMERWKTIDYYASIANYCLWENED